MPQAPDYLRRQWPEGDGQALNWLGSRGYKITRSGLIFGRKRKTESAKDTSAINYLIMEWDYAFVRPKENEEW